MFDDVLKPIAITIELGLIKFALQEFGNRLILRHAAKSPHYCGVVNSKFLTACLSLGTEEWHGNRYQKQHRGTEDGAAIALLVADSGRKRKHSAHHRPGKHIYHAADQGDGGVNTRLGIAEKMLYQHNIEIVDDYLSDEKHDRLHAFFECCWDPCGRAGCEFPA